MLMHNTLTLLAANISSHIAPYGFGAISWCHCEDHAMDTTFVVQWKVEPRLLQEEAAVEGVVTIDGGANDGKMPGSRDKLRSTRAAGH